MSQALATASRYETRVGARFDDRLASVWREVQANGQTDEVFQTIEWQQAWWETFGRGRLMLIAAERHGRPVALAPLFADGGMVFFVGSGGSDYLDFIGDVSDPDVLDAILISARNCVPNFAGFRFYHVPDQSMTGALLARAANRLGMRIFDEGELAAPLLDLDASGTSATEKTSLVRHERWFHREGELIIEHSADGQAVKKHLDQFFRQHIERWQDTSFPSLFVDDNQREFYRRLATAGGDAGWLRFTRVIWNGRTVACHFGFNYGGKFFWYKPAFAIDLAKRSPGEVLLRNLLLLAMKEGCEAFDFGLGDEAFKSRFTSRVNYVRTWGLYPVEECNQRQ
jgi:CelD/BcsL family acetyltransferase involved in cellulose biosynthesis